MKTVGIIGNGRFGDLLFNIFDKAEQFQAKMYSRSAKVDNVKFFELEEICKCEIIIPTVPISVFEEQIKSIKEVINSQENPPLVVDVCSVSLHPTKVLLENLDKEVDILSTHPMFGPDSTKNGKVFDGLKFIFNKTRISDPERCESFLNLWKDLGCNMIEMTPEEHDRQAAYTHAYAFLIGKIGINMNVRSNQISTKGFEGVLYNQQAVENDSGQLFDDMMTYNPYTKEMRKEFLESVIEINKKIDEK